MSEVGSATTDLAASPGVLNIIRNARRLKGSSEASGPDGNQPSYKLLFAMPGCTATLRVSKFRVEEENNDVDNELESINLSIVLSVCLSIYLFVYLIVYLSVCLSMSSPLT